MSIRNITLFSCLFLTFSALGSSVRTSTLGEAGGETGSLIYNDDRNIFYNPANLIRYNNMMIFNENEGGFFKKKNKFKYGINWGRDEESFTDIKSTLSSMANISTTDNNLLDLFISYRKIGFSLSKVEGQAKPSSSTNKESIDVMKANMGYVSNKFEIWAGYYLSQDGTDSSATQESFVGDTKYNVGLKTKFAKGIQYLNYKSNAYSYGTGTLSTFESSDLYLGFGKVKRLGKPLKLIYSIGYRMYSTDVVVSGLTTEYSLSYIPINLSFEYSMFKWFTLRAGTEFHYGKKEETKTLTTIDETLKDELLSINLGGSFSHKKMTLDFKYSSGFDHSKTGNDGALNLGSVSLKYSL